MQPDPSKDGNSKARPKWAGYYRLLTQKPLYLIVFVVILTAFLAGSWYGSRKTSRSGPANGRRILHYVDPMNPAHTSPKPGLAPCGMKMEPVYADEGQEVPPANLPPGAVKVTSQKQQLIGVRLGVVEKAPFKHTLRALGRVAVDETRIYRLNAFVDGWVLKIFDNSTGSLVMKDEPLLSFYSRDFITAEQAYFYALGALDRIRTAGQSVESQLVTTSAQIRGAEENLENLGMSKLQIKELGRTRLLTQNILISAPVTSFILNRNVSEGQKFTRNEDFYKLADLSHVWILADLYDNEAKYALPGVKVRVTLPNDHQTLWGRVSDILPQVDPVTRTYKVRLEIDNLDYALRPDMFVDLEFPVDLPAAMTVPADALLDTGLKKIVWVDRGDGYFEPREVTIGWRFGDRVEIVKGLEPGEKIVISGNFLIDSESRMRLAAAGMFGAVTKDPVCGLKVDESKAKATGFKSTFENQTYYFCSEGCKEHFAKNPGRYAGKAGEAPKSAGSDDGVKKAAESASARDPVSNLEVDVGYAATLGLKREYEGKTYYFRHYSSMEQFDKAPKEYANKPAVPLPAESPAAKTELKKPMELQPGQSEAHQPATNLESGRKANLPENLHNTPVTDKDPVCGMKLGEEVVRALTYKSAYQGKLYYFCSDECKREFERDPGKYAIKAVPGSGPAAASPETSPAPGLDMRKPQAQPLAPGPTSPPGTTKGLAAEVRDPVCGKEVRRGVTRGVIQKSVYQGKTYSFCSQRCKQEFDKDPKRYLNKTPEGGLISQQPMPSIIPGKDGRFRGGRMVTPKSVAPPVLPQTEGR